MANLQYIGARYVPKFYINPDYPAPDNRNNDWKSNVPYDALTIVTFNNDSYTSKKFVPDTVGDPANNVEYWACTTKYTAALMALQTIVQNLENFVNPDQTLNTTAQTVSEAINELDDLLNNVDTGVIPRLKMQEGITAPLSLLPGSDDTAKLQYAYDNGINVSLDKDVTIGNLDIAKVKKVYLFGHGHKLNMTGVISSTTQWGEEFYFNDIKFDGAGGGYFDVDFNYLVNCWFNNCEFMNFTHDVFVGKLQTFNFNGCFFKGNSQAVINATRLDALHMIQCDCEGGNDFINCTGYAYGCSIRDSVIENITGTAIKLIQPADCVIDGVYMEGNPHNIILQAEYSGNVTISNTHVNTQDASAALLEVIKTNLAGGMYGQFTVSDSAIQQGYIVKLGDTTYRYMISVNRCSIGGNYRVEMFDKSGVTSMTTNFIDSNDIHYEPLEITGSHSSAGEWLALNDLGCTIPVGHVLVGYQNHYLSDSGLIPKLSSAQSNSLRYFGYDTSVTANGFVLYR